MALKNWSTTASSNSSVDSINFSENQAPSTVNDSARALMADVRSWYDDAEWRDWGHTVTYASATTFTVSGDKTSIYVANRPIRCTDSTTLYGKVSSSSYGAPNTTVTVTLDSGSLSASLTAVALGQNPTGDPIDVSGVRGAVANTGNETIAGNKTFSGDTVFSGTATMSGKSIWFAEGADVASANNCNIWTTDGNTVHITGTTEIQTWGTAPQAGAMKMVIFDGALQLTYNATTNKTNTNGANYTTTAGDRAIVYAETTTSFPVTILPIDGSSPVDPTTTTTPVRSSDTTAIATTAWVRDHIGEPSNNLTVFKCGAVNIAQNATRYLKAVGASPTATETDAQVSIGLPTEIYGMKVYLSEAVPSGQTITITVRKDAADTSLTTTITGPTSAGAVVADVSGSVVFSKNYAGTLNELSVKAVTSATFGNTNDVVVTLLARVPGSNYKPVSPFALSAAAQGAGNYGAAGEFGVSARTAAVLSTTISGSQFPVPDTVLMKYDQAVATGWPYLNGLSGQQVTGSYNVYLAAGSTVSFLEETANTAHAEYIVFSDRECGNDKGTWAPLLFSSVTQAQNTTFYMGGYGEGTASTTEADVKVPVPAGKCWKLRAYSASAVPAGQSVTLTVRKNGVDQTVTCTISDASQYAADTSNSFSTADDDLISIKCVTSATSGTLTIHAVLELDWES